MSKDAIYREDALKREEMLIDALGTVPSKDIQALLIQTYIQEYGALSDANGEIVRQILMKGVSDDSTC